jgi:hypothetical protein
MRRPLATSIVLLCLASSMALAPAASAKRLPDHVVAKV